jgi:L-lactate dehydrogenase (cytochrome)
MREEIETTMRNIGIVHLAEAGPEYVHTGDVDHLVPDTRLHPYAKNVARQRQSRRASRL